MVKSILPERKSTKAKKKDFLACFEKYLGNISIACKAANIARNTFYLWCERDEKFNQAVTEIRERVGDFVESKLLENIRNGDTTSIIFYCKTRLKNRGYVEKTDLNIINERIKIDDITEDVTEDDAAIIYQKMLGKQNNGK